MSGFDFVNVLRNPSAQIPPSIDFARSSVYIFSEMDLAKNPSMGPTGGDLLADLAAK
jgi:hypothetical protein